MNKARIFFLAILLLATFFRFAYLDQIPNGFIPEEVSTGWNAYSLLKTGRDEWGIRLPIIFKETGGYKLALNSYLIVPVMALLGSSELSVRIPTAFAGVLSVILVYYLSKELFKKESYALAASLLLAICPWHIAMGRYAVDVNWGIPLFMFGFLLFLKSDRKPRLLLLSALSFGLSYYTYFNYTVFTILFLACILVSGWKRQFGSKKRAYTFLFIGIQFLFILPYIISPTLITRFSQATSVSQIGFVNRINEHREACLVHNNPIVCRLAYNKVTDRVLELSKNYINQFSTSTYFLYGSKLGLSGMPDHWGFLYPFEFALIGIGCWWVIRHKLYTNELLLWSLLALVPSSLAAEGHIWRMLTIVPIPQLIGGIGLIALVTIFPWKKLAILGISSVMVLFVARFWLDYTAYFPYAQARNAYYGFREAYQKIVPRVNAYDAILIAPSGLGFEQLYIYYVFYTKLDPRILQTENGVVRKTGNEGWVNVSRIGKWWFNSDPRNEIAQLPYKSLILTDETQKPYIFNEGKNKYQGIVLDTVSYPSHDTAFVILELIKDPMLNLPTP